MYVKKLRLKDYKRFHDLTINLGDKPKRIVALVGPNGCGKSSIFDAMIYRMKNYTGSFGSNAVSYDYHYHSLTQDPRCNSENVELFFDQGEFDQVYQKKNKSGRGKSIFSFRSSFRFNAILQIKQTRAVSDILKNSYGASGASDIDQRIEENYRRLLAMYNSYLDKNDARPSEAKRHIIGLLNTSLLNCLDLEIDNLGNIDADQGTLYFKKSDSDIVFSYNVLSAGEKEIVDILLDIFIHKETYTDSIYIFDEPELHLNTAIQHSLLLEINKLVPENCQIWIATHSIGFLRALQDELKDNCQIIKFDSEKKWASQPYTLTPIKVNRKVWQELFATAVDDLSQLICPQIIVYCEGRADPKIDGGEQGLDADVFNTIFAQQHPEAMFVSSGGNTELDQRSNIAIAILSKVFPSLKIWVLKDRDMASGKNTDEHTRQLYLQNNPENHRVLKRFEIENYLYDKELLQAYCEKNSLNFDENLYNDIVQDIVNDNLKDQTGRIKKCCSLNISINAERFKRTLAACMSSSMQVYKELESVIFDRT